jgi:hypothetical protein
LLADGGYEAVNPARLLKYYAPQFILISRQAGDNRSRDDPVLAEHLAKITTLSTDIHGSIDLATDGQNLWITVEHKQAAIPTSEGLDQASDNPWDS